VLLGNISLHAVQRAYLVVLLGLERFSYYIRTGALQTSLFCGLSWLIETACIHACLHVILLAIYSELLVTCLLVNKTYVLQRLYIYIHTYFHCTALIKAQVGHKWREQPKTKQDDPPRRWATDTLK